MTNNAGRARPRRWPLADLEFQAIDGFDFYATIARQLPAASPPFRLPPEAIDFCQDRALSSNSRAAIRLAAYFANAKAYVFSSAMPSRIRLVSLNPRLGPSRSRSRWNRRAASSPTAWPAPPRDCEPLSVLPKSMEPIKLFAVKKMPPWLRSPVTRSQAREFGSRLRAMPTSGPCYRWHISFCFTWCWSTRPTSHSRSTSSLERWVDGSCSTPKFIPGAIKDIEVLDSDDPRLPDNARDLLNAGQQLPSAQLTTATWPIRFSRPVALRGGLSPKRSSMMTESRKSSVSPIGLARSPWQRCRFRRAQRRDLRHAHTRE